MKHIIEYKQFENLASDFKEKADGLDTHDANNGYQAKKFCDLLTGNLKEEFMYRFTDGEMCLDLIEEFVDRVDLGDYDFHFRSLIASNKIKDMQQETGRGSLDLFHFIIDDLIVRSSRMGSDKTIAFLQDNFKDKFEPVAIAEVVKTGIEYLIKAQELFNWVYQKEQNVNKTKIKAAEELIKKLQELGEGQEPIY